MSDKVSPEIMSYGPHSQAAVCPRCNMSIQTNVKHESSLKTHLVALLLCILVCPCFWVPYCCDSCQRTNHYCPRCNSFLGTHDN